MARRSSGRRHGAQQLAESRRLPARTVVAEAFYAIRVLRRAPAVTMLSVATMGVGIGVSTILFALVSGILLRPLPSRIPNSSCAFSTGIPSWASSAGAASGNIDDWRRRSTRFDGIAGFWHGRTLGSDADAEVLIARR
jgi:putative ABC transport system permease protein